MMESRDLKEPDQEHYFMSDVGIDDVEEGTRDMFPLAPFVVSGGCNTERYYFTYVNDLSVNYKFNIRPKYFGDESAYIDVFPKRINEILSKNTDAKVFCVFDMDTVFKCNLLERHKVFVDSLRSEIDRGNVVLCDSMPSFEFWLLLHFVDYSGLLKNYSEVSQVLAPYIRSYFNVSGKNLKRLLKSEKYLRDSDWVKRLLDEGRLEQAVERAKVCAERAADDSKLCSYSNVFKAFEI